ncbi:MAG: UbiD family decarboxylase [Chitinispirillales bacterium]|jgi:4-hydroxy-3-polyprenylbenzoate decarboxylase|nr:UbiD family decarboxylase [Chitinispirillales bacterium]
MDLRSFISELDRRNLLTRVKAKVDWKHEIGRMTRENRGALLFDNIKDYPGYSILTGAMCGKEFIAAALGLNGIVKKSRISVALKERFKYPIKPVIVKGDFPLHDNIISGKDINLYNFPVPLWSEIDGGRFIGTWHLNVTKDPQTGSRNVGVYRMQILSNTTASISVSPASHLALHMNKAESLKKPLEMAVCIGVSELAVMCAAAAFPFSVDEYAMAGSLAQKPLELVKCRGVDLEVPADSEIVLEGEIKLSQRVKDGPYLDYAGVASSNPASFLFEVKNIMHRNNPVFRGTAVGAPGLEDHELLSVLAKLGLVDFHGSRMRQKVLNACLKNGNFRLFQMSGRLSKLFHKQ